MCKYEIKNVERYHAGGGTWLTICEVELTFAANELFDDTAIAEQIEEGCFQSEIVKTEWIVVGCGFLNVYDIKPFEELFDGPACDPVESFQLDEFEPVWLMENNPGLDLWDYCDPYWFAYQQRDGKLIEHPDNLMFNVCCWADKFECHKTGYCG